MTKFGVIIPYRNDRPLFLNNLKRMLSAQTVQPVATEIMDYVAESKDKDITQRYRRGYELLSQDKNIEVIFFIEVDDWYASNYFEVMLREWEANGKPELFGTRYTYYYHIKLFAFYKMTHVERSSAMSTMIKPNLNIKWCPDYEPYTDSHLWMVSGLKGVTFIPNEIICLGIKHGVGLLGGGSHINNLHRYKTGTGQSDSDKSFLKSVLDAESFEFYANYFNQEV